MTRRLPADLASVAAAAGGAKLHAPSAERNAAFIADLLGQTAPRTGIALELASGTGQHVVAFAARLPGLTWHPTDLDPERLASIAAYRAEAGLPNIEAPVALNATAPGWGAAWAVDLVVLVNLLHLIGTNEARTLIAEAARALNRDGRLVIYGPFLRAGELTSDGDRGFHERLVAADPDIGYKDDFDVMDWMQEAGLEIAEVVEMPANNLAIVARRL